MYRLIDLYASADLSSWHPAIAVSLVPMLNQRFLTEGRILIAGTL